MEAGIALLLTGACADLPAVVHAIDLAKRTTGIVHAVFRAERKAERKSKGFAETRGDLISLATGLGSREGVSIQTHILERMAGEPLIRFLCAQRIFCLVLGVGDQRAFARQTAWIELLRKQLAARDNWYLPVFWSVIVTPWDDPALEHLISRCKQSAPSSSVVGTLIDSLRKGRYNFNGIETKQESGKEEHNVHVSANSPRQC